MITIEGVATVFWSTVVVRVVVLWRAAKTPDMVVHGDGRGLFSGLQLWGRLERDGGDDVAFVRCQDARWRHRDGG